MNKKILAIFVVGLIIIGGMIPFTISVKAEDSTSYTLLAPLPNLNSVPNDVTALEVYLPYMFNLLIGLSATFAVLMIVIGGFQYMSSDALQKKENGKKRIQNSIYALVLVIGAYLILFTINPNLLRLNLNITSAEVPAPGADGTQVGLAMTPEQLVADTAVRNSLPSGVSAYRGPCSQGQTTECVNLNGLQQKTVTGLAALEQAINVPITITGGTEPGHSANSTHNTGAAVDIRNSTALNNYVLSNGGTPVQTKYGPAYTVTINGQSVRFLNEGADAQGSTGAHWHVTF